ncbi:PREDICTED: serine/threonine-protein kinase ATR [Drosophila arizonae]|uniref:Serine/threonine-protein kinase ATR n=1 Tax=Drosophila arizonae TaxID=7263 RepID=A0ABM1NZ35_DROAR|nr:PREDICTED: serine/threonine-protein kinase ATR [Drosophila arizonae]
MSGRRKDMWKLLYNLVNRNQSNLSAVYNVVDDILCQDPSLISCSSVNELKSEFQDAFLLWLLNKLSVCLIECTDEGQCLKNVQLQQKLLLSCWCNHPKLYGRLVEAYREALQQLYDTMSAFDYTNPDKNCKELRTLHLHIFRCDSSVLQEFDNQCAFQEIKLQLDKSDAYAKYLLLVLQQAHHIGHATHSDQFAESLHQALLTLKECNMDTKLTCLSYCHSVLQAHTTTSWSNSAAVAHYAALTLRALALMWSLISRWKDKCMTQAQLERLVTHTEQLLLVFTRQKMSNPDSLELSCQLLHEVLSQPASDWRCHLLQVLCDYLQEQLKEASSVLPANTCQLLLRQWRGNPEPLLSLLAAVAAKQPAIRDKISLMLSQSLARLLAKPTPEKLPELLAVLRGLKHMERLLLMANQQELVAASDEALNTELLAQLPQHHEVALHTDANSNWNVLSAQLLEDSLCVACPEFMEICALLLHCTCLRLQLKPHTQQLLLGVLQRALQSSEQEKKTQALLALATLRLEIPSSAHTQLQSFFAQKCLALLNAEQADIVQLLCEHLPQLYVAGYIKSGHLQQMLPKLKPTEDGSTLAAVLRLLLCTQQPEAAHVFKAENRKIILCCSKCEELPATLPGLYLGMCKPSTAVAKSFSSSSMNAFVEAMLFKSKCAYIAHHLDLINLEPSVCLNLLRNAPDLQALNERSFERLVPVLAAQSPDFMQQLASLVLGWILDMLAKPLEAQSETQQQKMLRLIVCAAHPEIDELWLFHWFKMTFFFLVHTRSLVAQEAVLAACQLCARHDLQPLTLWNWYKRDALGLVVQLALQAYLTQGVRFTHSLRALTRMLGYSCVQEFTCKYHRLLTTLILPYCIKEPRCKGVFVLISKQVHKPIAALFSTSFLRLYAHVHLSEPPELANRCIELVASCTQSTLQELMNADVKQTVAELLIYFNRNPTFVMRSFQSLLQLSGGSESLSTQATNAQFSTFIAERILGVITYFESCLSEASFEKSLKEETLYSLGQILRFVGPQHVTQFRFKIIAMLSFVHTLQEPNLQRICLKIWHIFLHVVNIQELGPSLGRIVATLQPLLAYSVEQVNELYEFVILRNASMLGSYIQDLYFLERLEHVSTPIRECIKRHTAQLCLDGPVADEEEAPLLDQLRFLHKQITNECLQVRVYGLEHLAELFGRRRAQLNHMILHKLPMEPLMEQIVNILMSGSQHDDRSLQLASAKCLGELGAIDASYLPSNYNYASSQQLPLSVLTDDFTVLALTALCRGYQFQQKTKHVDSFSLAIQETLAVCGIAPKEQKKLQLWQSLPVRMREIMEPLLNSCYTCSQRPNTLTQHPLFGSHYTHNSYELWAFLWASRLIDYVQSSDTRHLLSSYKPCIRRDSNMLSTFYPYILLHALLECNAEQRTRIEEEFQTVLQANEELSKQVATPAKTAFDPTATNRNAGSYKLFESMKYRASTKTTNDDPLAGSSAEDQSRLAGKLCAELLDFLQRWLREWQRQHGLSMAGKPPQDVDANYGAIYEFVQRIDKLRVARASYNCGEYARALRYLEAYIDGDKTARLLEQFTFLVELYGRLMDADSVEGAVQTRSCDMSVTQEILVNRLVERQQDMITCYEQLLSSTEQLQPEHIRAIIDAYLRMDTPKTALLIADGLSQRLADQHTEQYFSECKAELLWRLGSYDELEELQLQRQQQSRCKPNWHAQCAQACLALRQPMTTKSEFDSMLDSMRCSVLDQLRSCSALQQHSYAHAYDDVLKLHMLHELQCSHQLVEQLSALQQEQTEQQQTELMRNYFADWQSRLQILQPQLRVLEPIYSFRRNLLAELKRRLGDCAPLQAQLRTQLAQLWLNSAQINRNAGQLQRAHLYLMKAAEYKPSRLFLERAKLLWQKGDQVQAMNFLEEQLSAIVQQCEGNVKQLSGEQRQLYFEGKYLQATYNADSMNLCADAILKYFQEAIAVHHKSERCFVQLAQFLEKMREARAAGTANTQTREDEELLLQIMVNYAKSLRYGSDHVYQSMPRLISLWLDTAATATAAASTSHAELVRKMNDLLSNCCTALSTGMFYAAYSQMLSRLCHPSVEVFAVLRTVIIMLIREYPQQSLWMLLPHFKSAAVNRVKRCNSILTDERLQNAEFQRLLSDFNTLTDRLICVTNKEVTLDRSYKLSDLDKRLPQLCGQANFSNIMLPFEKYMQPTFNISSAQDTTPSPSPGANKLSTSNWFPYKHIYITGFQEKVLVLRSAARPKKLTIRCSDGQDYDIMVKPKDDLRKDARLMEFNGLMKRYLHQDASARQRRLHIRTYAVLPFNEECGLLEWLPNLNSYRSICIALYMQRGQVMSGRQLQQLALPQTESIERKRAVFLNQLLPAHPPVFQEWLLQRFTTPHSWYEARNSYIRTVAVMSMVGYILGLGDRHGENILFDERNGDAVHVDFNCLFNQGEAFAYPEVVPFRLTRNMITAMGPLGVEGSFRKCCEITLRLLKQETKTLMSMLRPFVYDLGVQSRLTASTSNRNKHGAEVTDPKVTNDVQRIAERLQGHVKRQQANSIPLSTEGQVNFLINEATKVDNLAAMYIGWGAFL